MSTAMSHVALAKHLCLVCTTPFDSGEILLHKRLRDIPEEQTYTGWGLCPEHQQLKDDGYVALVAIIDPGVGTKVKPQDAVRTGSIVHVREAVWGNVFNVPVPQGGVCFVSEGVVNVLKGMTAEPAEIH